MIGRDVGKRDKRFRMNLFSGLSNRVDGAAIY